ncbi:hypothetical protein M0813_01399 [Anaeramoeba flamelloides]|uniref:Uncharacterized protein n=1 Tax=Anaeramoeba flamelloides TaxID=1746091 RepID=A0ABQ8Z8Z0_9EUKA|nr:hypothetical protein M0813_01399 [Anaeramoeba flamelloides]
MQNSSKPFPHSLNPIFVDSTNWVLMKTIQTKKTLAKKYAKNNIFCAWHGQFCSKNNAAKYIPQVHGGEFNSRKSQKHQSKNKNQAKRKRNNRRNQSQGHLCRNCIQLWRKWNAKGNPIIGTLKERIKVFENEEDPESDEKTDSDGEYLEKEEGETKTTNLCHNPSYNAEEMRIYLMTEEEKKKELAFQILEREEKEDLKRKRQGENQISQLKKKFHPNEDQIIRQKSLESGKEPLSPTISSELLNPHSNYLVDSEQMIQLLNNVHCPCGRKKILKDLKEGYGSFKAILLCPNCPIEQWENNEEIFFFFQRNWIKGMTKRCQKRR